MDRLQDCALIFHNYHEGCCGLICSRRRGDVVTLYCAECGEVTGVVDTAILEDLFLLIGRAVHIDEDLPIAIYRDGDSEVPLARCSTQLQAMAIAGTCPGSCIRTA